MLPATTDNPKQRALARRRAARSLGLSAGLRSTFVLGTWLTTSIALGLVFGSGALVHAVWLWIVSIAALLSPFALIAMRRSNERFKAGRLALTDGEHEAAGARHLDPALARFLADTRVARIGLSDAVEPGEGDRLLWEWRKSLEALSASDRDRLAELGVGLGPIEAMLAAELAVDRDDDALDDAQLRDAELHLGHVERMLGEERGRIYR